MTFSYYLDFDRCLKIYFVCSCFQISAMPRFRKRVTDRVPLHILEQASNQVREGMSVRSVAKTHSICHVTLHRFVKKREQLIREGSDQLPNAGHSSHTKVFTEAQEKELVKYLLEASDLYYGLSPKEVRLKDRYITYTLYYIQ